MACMQKFWEREKLHVTSSFFFSNNFSTLPGDKIVGRSKLEAFEGEFKPRHKVFFCHDRMENIFKKKKENCCLKVALQILRRKFYKNTEKTSLYSQSLFIIIHKTPVVESHQIRREIRDLRQPRLTPTGNTVYFCMSSLLIYILKIHRQSFKHSIR